jgi:hypothetical protein
VGWRSDRDKTIAAIVEHWSEKVLADIRKQAASLDDLSATDQLYLRAYWGKIIDSVIDIHKSMTPTEDQTERLSLILEMFGEQLNVPSSGLKVDVAARLDWLKRRTAKEFLISDIPQQPE